MLKRSFLAIPLVAVLSMSLLIACGDKKEAAAPAKAEKVLRVGTNPTFAPFEFRAKGSNDLTGFDIDLAKALGKQMGYKVELVNLGFDGLIPALSTGNIDLAVSGMSITEERKNAVDFCDPYYTSGLIVLVRPDETNIKGINDLVGKRIGAQIGTTGATKASSVKGADVKQYNNANEPFIELDNKGVDAVINDQPVVAYYLVNGGKGKMVGDIMEAEYYGIAAKKGNKALVKQVNEALAALKKNGEYDKIYKKWFGA